MNIKELIKEGFDGEVLKDVMLKGYTSLRIGGKADYLFFPSYPFSLKGLIDGLIEAKVGYLVIGGGTNLLVMEERIEEVFISLRDFRKMKIVEDKDSEVLLFVESGMPLQRLLSFCRGKGLSGIEGLVGIPGTVGGAIFSNSGAYGYEIIGVIDRLTVLENGDLRVIKRSEMNAKYRNSGVTNKTIVLAAHLLLKKGDRDALHKRMDKFLKMRKDTQPLEEKSAGCVFKNPDEESAGRLIDMAGCKGMRIGDIEVSKVHANFFINKGEGRAKDFLLLMENVRERVKERFGIFLEPEIKIAGRK